MVGNGTQVWFAKGAISVKASPVYKGHPRIDKDNIHFQYTWDTFSKHYEMYHQSCINSLM